MDLFTLPKDEIKLIGFENQIYGFPTNKGLKTLTKEIVNIKNQLSIDFINGVDLGCGNGALIDHFNKEIKDSNWIGIELSHTRIELSKYKNDNLIIEGCLLQLDYNDYNFIYVNNLCFDEILNEKLENKIINEFNGLLLTTTKIENIRLIKDCNLIKKITSGTNWNKNHIFYLYLI